MSIKKGYWNSNALANPAMRSRDDSYSIVKLGNGESWDIDSAMTNIESSGSNKIHICTLNKDTYTDAAIDTLLENFGATLELTIDSSTFVITAILKNKDGTTLGTPQTIDLPLESVVVSGSYDNATKSLILTLENGNTITIPIADLISGLQEEITVDNKLDADLVDDSTSTNKFVTASDITNWNNHIASTNNPHQVTKAQVGLGNVDNTSDLDKPISTATQTALNGKQATISDLATIRSNAQAGKTASDTIATYGDIVTHDVAEFATAAQGAKADTALQAGDNVSELVNDAGYLVMGDLTNFVTKNTAQTISGLKTFSADITLSGTTSIKNTTNGVSYTMLYRDASGIHVGTSTQALLLAGSNARPKFNNNDIAMLSDVPTAVSQLTNDTGFITNAVNDLQNYTLTSSLATVATSGSYNDLSDKPTIPAAQVNSDWNANSGVAQILNKPTLATVATSGSYTDLSNKPTIPTVNNPTITITQGGVTKGSFTLNQASGDTIALDAGGGGGSVDIDNTTITKNSDDEIQAVAVIDQNTGIAKTWTGTMAEYEAIVTKDPETEYIITDDIGGSATEIGEITEDINDLKEHTVIEFQEPTAGNNYTWYRLYSDGWVEQGGLCSGTAENNPVTMPIEMSNTEYQILAISDPTDSANSWGWIVVVRNTKTTTGFSLGGRYGSGSVVPVRTHWQVSGMAA